jgi:hypothetical protein
MPSDRAVRALKPDSHLVVYPDDPEAPLPEEVAVYSGGTRYVVNLDLGFCECKDHHYRKRECYHLKRARFELVDGVPEWADRDAVCPLFGALTDPDSYRDIPFTTTAATEDTHD